MRQKLRIELLTWMEIRKQFFFFVEYRNAMLFQYEHM